MSAPANNTKRGMVDWGVMRKKAQPDRFRLVKGKYLCIVTGAGNGLGRALANLVYQDGGIFPTAWAGSKLILIDKDMESLQETSGKKMKQFLKHRKIEVDIICADLGNLSEAKTTFKTVLDKNDKDFEHVTFIDHANTLGDTSKKLAEQNDYANLQDYFDLNITSKIFLTSEFFIGFPKSKKTIVFTLNKYAASSTSYLGLGAISNNATKAYADVLAKENPAARIVCFTATEMESNKSQGLLESCGNEELKEQIKYEIESQKLLSPLEVAKKLTKIIEEDKFQSGVVLSYPNNDLVNGNE